MLGVCVYVAQQQNQGTPYVKGFQLSEPCYSKREIARDEEEEEEAGAMERAYSISSGPESCTVDMYTCRCRQVHVIHDDDDDAGDFQLTNTRRLPSRAGAGGGRM